MQKHKHYKLRSKMLHFGGTLTLGLTTVGGFFGYQALTDFEAFKTTLESETFMVVDPEHVTLNPFFAVPLVIGMIIFLFVTMKRDRDFFKGRSSIGIVLTMAILYGVYSIAIMAIATLAGALVGSVIDEVLFTPLSKRALVLAQEQRETELEYQKEERRILARQEARKKHEELNDFGNV